ncbi:uncharacterized protein LOC110985082 [Acanthaster planci]|uniref:Uncharacterized protein LOC110985082 n=1 Tax=Acanthaster planci TaxID=133434 RepID=A0A8B7ZE88_ACAPL|nr:uncharacterized protein LOC110985082 [Acanthaster planci]
MSLSVIMEEPLGFQEDDLEFVGRVSHTPSQPHKYGGRKRDSGRYGSPTGRYIRAAAGRSLGGLRPSQSYSPNSPRSSRMSAHHQPRVTPIRFIRNPRHPKSLYDTEISMRNFMRRGPPKPTPELSFPDPSKHRAFRNPMAPRFHHEFDFTEEDYDIKRNPLAGVHLDVLLAGTSEFPGTHNRGYDDTGDRDIDSNDQDSSDSDESESSNMGEDLEAGDDVSVNDSASRIVEETQRRDGAIYSSVNKNWASKSSGSQQMRAEPPPFAPQPPPVLPKPAAKPLVIPRAVANQDEYRQQEPTWEEEKEIPPPVPEPLDTLAEEDEDQQEVEEVEVEPVPESAPQELRDMSTQTNLNVQAVGGEQDEPEEGEEAEERFIQIQEGREDVSIMTHENWEAVAPWSQRSSEPVNRSTSLAVNYRRVVAELSGVDRQRGEPPQEQRPRHQEGRRDPSHIREEPPPWSPPIVPQMEQILRPIPGDMRNYPPPSREWDAPRRRYPDSGIPMAAFCNRCCFVTLLLLALGVIIGLAVVTSVYVTSGNCDGAPCGLIQEQGYLGGLVALGALAILVVFALFTWCCYNVSRRQRDQHKYRPRERQMYLP